MMNREAHALALASILEASSDRATTSELVTQISDHNGEMSAKLAVAEAEIVALRQRNADLTEQNTKLFLRVGNVPTEEPKENDELEKPTFESLFDANGNLK